MCMMRATLCVMYVKVASLNRTDTRSTRSDPTALPTESPVLNLIINCRTRPLHGTHRLPQSAKENIRVS